MHRRVGRYVILDELAAGGMARVHIGKLSSEGGFSRVVAIKVLHAQFARDADFRAMFLDEARLVGRIRHPNVVSTLDVLEDQGELFLVMDYVHGLPLSRVIRTVRSTDAQVPIPVTLSILLDTLEGLHAAHEARAESGVLLRIVHRDVSPQNIMVGSDGLAHVVDFGVAHAVDRLHRTIPGQIKGKASYMAPEQATGTDVDCRADIYAAGVVLWEALVGERLFQGASFAATILQQLQQKPAAPSTLRHDVPTAVDDVVLRALAKRPEDRFASAEEMSQALERAAPRASRSVVAAWVEGVESRFFAERGELLSRVGREVLTPTRADTDPSSEVPVGRELQTSGPRAVRSHARSRRMVALAGAALLVPVMIAGMVASRRFSQGSRSSRSLGAASSALVAQPASPAPVSSPSVPMALSTVEAVSLSDAAWSVPAVTSAPETHGTPPQAQRSAIGRHPASTVMRPARADAAPATQLTCCSPDGTLQLRFHDCVDNCKN